MALKSILESLDGLSEDVKKEYTEKDGKFYLDIEGLDEHPGVGALKRAKDHEKSLRQKAEGKVTELENTLTEKETEIEGLRTGAVPKDDVNALKTSYETKLSTKEAEFNEKYGKLNGLVEKHMLDGKALEMATAISTVPALLVPHIRGRLKLEEVNGELSISVLDQSGKPSAASLDDLSKELLSNKNFAPILIGSKASGGGASGGSGGGGASKKLGDMNEAERTQFAKNDPEGFRAALREQQAAASKY